MVLFVNRAYVSLYKVRKVHIVLNAAAVVEHEGGPFFSGKKRRLTTHIKK